MSEDNWEDIFKKKLESQQDPFDDSGWNVPSDKVWEEIVTQLPPNDKKKKGLLFFLLPSAVLLLGVSIWLTFINLGPKSLQSPEPNAPANGGVPTVVQTQRPGVQSPQPTATSATMSPEENVVTTTAAMASALTNVKGALAKPASLRSSRNRLAQWHVAHESNLHSNTNVAANTSQQKLLDASSLSAKSNSRQPSQDLAQDESSQESSPVNPTNAPVNAQIELSSAVIDRGADLWKEVQILSTRSIAPLLGSPYAIATSTAYLKTPSRPSRYFLHIGGGPMMLQPKQTGEKQHFSFSTNLGLEYAWTKKWSFELGAQYVNLIQKLQYNIDLPYNGSNEALQSDGNFDSKYSGQVNTSLGDVNMSMVLSRLASSSLALGEKINLDVSGTERIQLLQLPIGMKYIFDLGKWNPYVRASYIPTFVLQSSVDFNTVHSNHPAVHHRGTNARISNHADFVSGFGTTAGLQYKCTSRLFVTGEVQYQYLITPLSKSQTVNPSLLGVNLGLRYGF